MSIEDFLENKLNEAINNGELKRKQSDLVSFFREEIKRKIKSTQNNMSMNLVTKLNNENKELKAEKEALEKANENLASFIDVKIIKGLNISESLREEAKVIRDKND